MIDTITGNHLLALLPILLGGALLGIVFFAGLYWTVQRGIRSAHPALWFLSSFIVRTSITLAGIDLLTDGQGSALLVCMLGFIMMRFAITAITGPSALADSKKQESRHAP